MYRITFPSSCKNSAIAPNSLRVQALTSPSNHTKENSPENVVSESTQLALDPSKRTFCTFLKSIEFLVPSDSLEFLILHKRVVLPFRSLYRSQCADLIGLIKTRIEDLRLALSKSEPGVSIQANIANDVVAYVEAFFESGGNIPHALLQTALFRKQFFTKHFLPVLLSNTQAFISQKNFDFHVEKKKMISKLAEKSLIPPSVFSEFLSMHPNNTQEGNHLLVRMVFVEDFQNCTFCCYDE